MSAQGPLETKVNRFTSEQVLQPGNIFDHQISHDIDSVNIGRQVSSTNMPRIESNNQLEEYPNVSP